MNRKKYKTSRKKSFECFVHEAYCHDEETLNTCLFKCLIHDFSFKLLRYKFFFFNKVVLCSFMTILFWITSKDLNLLEWKYPPIWLCHWQKDELKLKKNNNKKKQKRVYKHVHDND